MQEHERRAVSIPLSNVHPLSAYGKPAILSYVHVLLAVLRFVVDPSQNRCRDRFQAEWLIKDELVLPEISA